MGQSEFEVIACNRSKARENARMRMILVLPPNGSEGSKTKANAIYFEKLIEKRSSKYSVYTKDFLFCGTNNLTGM